MDSHKLVAVTSLLLLPIDAYAVPVVYTITTTGEVSSLGSIITSTAPINFVGTADTANLQELREIPASGAHGSRIYVNRDVIQLTSLIVTVGNSPPATFVNTPSLIYAYAEGVDFSDSNGQSYFGYSVPTLPTTPDILASLTTTPVIFPNYAFVGTAATDLGTLTVTGSPVGYKTTFSVTPGVPVPEPSSAALVTISLIGLLYASRQLRLFMKGGGGTVNAE